jgi:hypothetical protein
MQGDGSNGESPTASPSVVSGLAGVRGYVIGDASGGVIQVSGFDGGERLVAFSTGVANTLDVVGSRLGLGDLLKATLRADNGSWVVGFRDAHSIVVDVEPTARIAIVEFAVGLDDWVPKTELKAEEPAAELVADVPLPQTAPDGDAGPTAEYGVPYPIPLPQFPKPPAPRRSLPSGARLSTTPATPSLSNANARGLRRALAKGDLSSVREIAEHLRRAYAPSDDLCGSGTSAQAIGPLMAGIAAVLAGDGRGAMMHLESASAVAGVGYSLNWAALFWSARASIGMVRGLDTALNYAKVAAQVSKKLDVEARALSARLLAELYIERRESEKASKFLDYCKRFLESLGNVDELAEVSLLEAKVLLLTESIGEAMSAAERAHATRPVWVAPIALLCRCALGSSDVQRAEELVAPLVERGSDVPEILRIHRLIKEVQRGGIAPGTAAEFLELSDAMPERATLSRLEKLCQGYPRIEAFHEMLGWKLLKIGDVTDAQQSFAQLGNFASLPDDVRTSLFLAWGCIAATAPEHSNSGMRLRATVDAVPRPRQSTRPPAPAAHYVRTASPVDLATFGYSHLMRPSLPVPPGGPPSSPRHGGPSLAGTLRSLCLQDLLEFLNAGRCSGILVCGSVRGVGGIALRDGRIAGAASPTTPRLGDALCVQQKVDPAALEKAAALQAAGGPRLPIGTILVKNGWLAPEDLEAALRTQAENAIAELLDWGDGQFAFNPDLDANPAEDAIELAIEPLTLLLSIFSGATEIAMSPS